MKRIHLFTVYFISFIYMEFLYHFLIYGTIFKYSNLHLIIYTLFAAGLFAYISSLFSNKLNKIVFYTILGLFCLWFSAQFVVKDFMDFNISFSILQIADQLESFVGKTISVVLERTFYIIIIFIPFIFSIIFRKKISFRRLDLPKKICYPIIICAFYGSYLLSLNIYKNKDYSPYVLYYQINNPSLNIERIGVINTLFVDSYRALFGFNEKIIIDSSKKSDTKTNYKYNTLNFDFDALANDSDDETVKKMTEYFASDNGTQQNEYTDYFKGKNLILFMAESFNEIAVNEKTTPTLYKLVNNGFVFKNYYTPTIYSTIGGEFQELTSLYANFSSLSTYRSGTNSFPMGVATSFKNSGYNTYAYHDNSYAFQDRNVYLKTLGFDNFKACYNGLEESINCHTWPQSDVEMIEATYSDYINSDKPFMVFYASVSGHASYNFTSNAMAKKHEDEIKSLNLGYSDSVLAYMAAQMEFDKALELLIEKLDEAGKLDDTVIVFAGDHYPYELTCDEVNEAASYTKDCVVEINHSNLAIWNSKMDNVNIDKVGSTIDVMPTIYNLFGIDYDSRILIGKDILSTEPGLAMFGNNSWVSDEGTYYSASGEFKANSTVDDGYVSSTNRTVQNKIAMSKYIVEKDYYRTLWNYKK